LAGGIVSKDLRIGKGLHSFRFLQSGNASLIETFVNIQHDHFRAGTCLKKSIVNHSHCVFSQLAFDRQIALFICKPCLFNRIGRVVKVDNAVFLKCRELSGFKLEMTMTVPIAAGLKMGCLGSRCDKINNGYLCKWPGFSKIDKPARFCFIAVSRQREIVPSEHRADFKRQVSSAL